MNRKTVEKANEIIKNLDTEETALKILEDQKSGCRFWVKGYRNKGISFVEYNDIPISFEKEEIEILIGYKKKKIKELKEKLENLSDDA